MTAGRPAGLPLMLDLVHDAAATRLEALDRRVR